MENQKSECVGLSLSIDVLVHEVRCNKVRSLNGKDDAAQNSNGATIFELKPP